MTSVTEAAALTHRNPSEAQKIAGNYRKGRVRLHGLEISIENPCGSFRTGTGADGKVWRCRLPAHYGDIKRTEAADGDNVDAFIGPHHKSPLVYVIDQHDADHGGYDEAKVMLGFATPAQAKHTYLRAFSDGKARDRLGAMHEMTVAQLKEWFKDGDTKRPYRRARGGRLRADGGKVDGMLIPGTIDIHSRPVVHNADGTISTVRSISVGDDQGREVLIPTVSPDGRVLSNADATRLYQMSGQHLGIFDSPDSATAYAQSLHQDQAQEYMGRAGGGRVAMADGGTANPFDAFDQKPAAAPAGNPFDEFDAGKPAAGPDEGKLHAVGHGALAGATLNFGDELAGVRAAGSQSTPDVMMVGPVPVPARTLEGAYHLAKNWMVGGNPEALAAYEKARDAERAAQESAKAHHPYLYGAGEVAGSVPAMAAMPEAGIVSRLAPGAGRLARAGAEIIDAATTGAGYGAVSGAGEGKDMGERVQNAAAGTAGGALAGAVAPVASNTLAAAYDRFGRPIVQTMRGWAQPEQEAARRVAAALDRDQQLIASGQAKGMSLPEWQAARAAGEPVTLADLGAGHTQSLLRSAANTSPEGRAMLEQVLEGRFLNQGERVAGDVRGLVAGGANANKTADQLVAEYDAGRAPLYRKAFAHPNAQGMYDDTLEQVTQAPVVQQAIRMANITAKNEAAKIGLTPMKDSPFVFDQSGRMTLRDPNMTPNLQYWDAVKKNLDKLGPEGAAWARTLRDHLDTQVKDYGEARGFAANFFGERDALDAGRKLAGKRVDPETIRSSMRKMDPHEQELFREGYASDWADRVVGNISETRDITKAMFNSPNERERARAVFGDAGMRKMESRMSLETIMNGARNAMGGSTTARQLIEAGLAGGALGGYEGYNNMGPLGAVAGAATGAAAGRMAIPHLLQTEVAAGARRLIGKVDGKTAANVARLLTSDDPAQLAQGLRLAMANQRVAEGLKRIANTVALSSAAPSGREAAVRTVPMLQGAVGARADDKQTQP